MNILIISQYFYPESFRINDIASEWVKRGHKVSVVTGIPNYPEGRFYKGYSFRRKRHEKYNGINIHRLSLIPRGHSKIGITLNYLSFMISGLIWAHTTRIKADVVFSFETSPMTQVLIGTKYSKRTHTRHLVYVQDLWPENVEEVGGIRNPVVIKPLDSMVKFIYRNADMILATSPSFVKMITKRMADDKKAKCSDFSEKVIYWPQYAEDFYKPIVSECPKEDDAFRIVFTGNIGYAQGLEILPECARMLMSEGYSDRIRFVLVGDGRARQDLKKSIERLGVGGMFIFVGRKKPEEIPGILSENDIAYLSFSNNKLFEATIPAKLQSYMACGMPVLASASGETERIITEAGCGICCHPGDCEELKESIIRFMKMSMQQLKLLSKKSFEYSGKYFDRDMLMDEMERHLTCFDK